MNPYYEATVSWYENIAREGRENPSAHRRKICQNYLEHAALEYTDRWPEIFTPERTVEHPVYKVHWGTSETVVYDGLDAVKGFYLGLKDAGTLSNQDELLSVADWGFSSFLKINLYRTGAQLLDIGAEIDDPDGEYVIQTPCAMYWLYDENARLIGENVYEMEPGVIRKLAPGETLTGNDLWNLVKPYLPHGREVGTSDAFRDVR
ncbi:MAG TPA: hypothetical protein VHZ33_30360 [Trebonia sp.]|jgi:hypothetical protein|nr:hypothetical protein [Trebonia sp.]